MRARHSYHDYGTPRLVLVETLPSLLLRESGGAVVITCGRVRNGAFVQAVAGFSRTAVLSAGSPSQLMNIIRTRHAPLFVIVHDPELYENDEEIAARVAAMLWEYACSSANRIVLLARPRDVYLDVMWPYAGRYLYIERDCEWKNGRITCDRQMTLDAIGEGWGAGERNCKTDTGKHYAKIAGYPIFVGMNPISLACCMRNRASHAGYDEPGRKGGNRG